MDIKLTKLFQHDILEPFMSDKLHPGVEDCEDVVGVLGAAVPRLQECLNFPQIFALFQQ